MVIPEDIKCFLIGKSVEPKKHWLSWLEKTHKTYPYSSVFALGLLKLYYIYDKEKYYNFFENISILFPNPSYLKKLFFEQSTEEVIKDKDDRKVKSEHILPQKQVFTPKISGKENRIFDVQYAIKESNKEPFEEVFFTEKLAKIYEKQEHYKQALKIYKYLNLKKPKKNTFLAKIKFLTKKINEK